MTVDGHGRLDEPLVLVPEEEDAPPIAFGRRQALLFGLFVASAVAFLYFVLPQLTGLSDTA